MKKEFYNTPELEIISFITEDVITESGGGEIEPEETVEPSEPMLPWD